KPLLRKVNVGVGNRLDEPATVENIARTQLCLPVLEPQQASWFDIILIVDRGSSMAIWHRLVKDVVRILRRYGAFRDVRAFDLVVNPEAKKADDKVLLMSNPQRPGHRPSELIDKQGRRIAIVLSDCAGKYWWNGTLLPMLQDWGNIMPTVVWQMLPAWMWRRTALGRGDAVAIGNDLPGAANQRLQLQIQQLQESDASPDTAKRMAVPVITSEVRDIARWSLMVAGDRREITPGFLLPASGGSVPRSQTYEEIAQERAQQTAEDASDAEVLQAAFNQSLDALATERVQRFIELASPAAQRLMMLLAAAPVITLPVVRLIRDAMLTDVRTPLPVAEVFLSGLLQRLPNQDDRALEQVLVQEHAQAQRAAQNPMQPAAIDRPLVPSEAHDLVQYDFAPQVRSVLLKFLPAVDTIEVINSVSAAVERRWNQVSDEDFRAFLMHPDTEVPEELAGLRSFASVTADILEPLGGRYAEFAQDLRHGTGQSQSEPTRPTDFNDLLFESFTYEVAEYLNFPPLEPFEFIDGQPIDATELEFPPPLQAEEVTVITLQPQAAEDISLSSFDFTVVTLVQTETQWEIQRYPQQTRRFIEVLPGDLPLEMVAIPGGTFLMGSPEDEPERFSRESPQHEVTVAPFLMGRYPVTQAQWRAVAAMPQVERELEPDPAHFKGDNHPVERVSWEDAVEFCARLSHYTERSYRLPSESEWEYGCRAGTNTPFHFGDMITTEVASYYGASYAEGPEGESRNETTPVDHFEGANAFGLSDMHGNVWEGCQDSWHSNYEGAPVDGSAWVDGGNSSRRVYRGGSWGYDPRNCRSASRVDYHPDFRLDSIGFRVCCSAPRALP
ncbi:MAG: formylglycine-generating enzyme family protein, partial [Cyanobacteria bacterium J06559_3]